MLPYVTKVLKPGKKVLAIEHIAPRLIPVISRLHSNKLGSEPFYPHLTELQIKKLKSVRFLSPPWPQFLQAARPKCPWRAQEIPWCLSIPVLPVAQKRQEVPEGCELKSGF